jgi:hypothetical protein
MLRVEVALGGSVHLLYVEERAGGAGAYRRGHTWKTLRHNSVSVVHGYFMLYCWKAVWSPYSWNSYVHHVAVLFLAYERHYEAQFSAGDSRRKEN